MNCNAYYRHSPKAQRLPNRPASFSWSPVDNTPLDSIKGEVALMGWASGFGWAFGIKERDEDKQKEIDEEYNAMKAKEAGNPVPTSIERDPKKVFENGIEQWDAGTEEEKRVLKVVDPKRLLEEDIQLANDAIFSQGCYIRSRRRKVFSNLLAMRDHSSGVFA
ncbi:hypothetical protein N7G274_006037 [Stereocaulon virgatum]|uniref:Uncharacterized protein n=1 Tax=Stereocaulon virgatum TaxID=373712 RepID=A0ABR4ACI1_9LECA